MLNPKTIANCILYCKIRTLRSGETNIDDNEIDSQNFLYELGLEIQRLRYEDPMGIENLLNYAAEQEVTIYPLNKKLFRIQNNQMVKQTWQMYQMMTTRSFQN